MSEKKVTLVLFAYDDGSMEFAAGDHAVEVMGWLNSGQSMLAVHGGQYSGRKMVLVPASPEESRSPFGNNIREAIRVLRSMVKGDSK